MEKREKKSLNSELNRNVKDELSHTFTAACKRMNKRITQVFGDDLSGSLGEYWGANSIMKSEEDARVVRDQAVEEFKGFGL